ncbi:MAG: Cna B-type domain-containing protein, partial [Gemella morbillorum]|uniref:Cna B-type domain-containing protein n=1 Tax=Gemella morbillorum TaxID=29391 RepID=UPI001CB5E8CA
QGTKTWDDANNQDGKRPDKIKVILNKTVDGQTTKVTEKEVTKDNWNYEFNDLPKYENGKEITYSIDEEAVPGYEKEVTGYNLKNSHTPEKVNVQGTKTWDDANNKYGKRPEKITVILNKTVDGKTSKIIEATVTKDDNWSYSFKNLPKYENGKLITYTIDEEAVAGYKKTIDGYNLKNTYIPPKPKLPNTGSTSTELGGLGFLAALTGLVLARRKNKTN